MIDTEGFRAYICARSRYVAIGHGMVWVALGLNVISHLLVETGPGTNVIIGLNYVGMVFALLVSGGVMMTCKSKV